MKGEAGGQGSLFSLSGRLQTAPDAICAECGEPYAPYKRAVGYQKYCSPECRKAVWARGEALGAREAREEALERVRREDFQREALRVIGSFPAGLTVTGEEVRQLVEEAGLEPHHHNAWGALVMTAVKRGLLENTGRYVPMKVPSSHARRTAVYKRRG